MEAVMASLIALDTIGHIFGMIQLFLSANPDLWVQDDIDNDTGFIFRFCDGAFTVYQAFYDSSGHMFFLKEDTFPTDFFFTDEGILCILEYSDAVSIDLTKTMNQFVVVDPEEIEEWL